MGKLLVTAREASTDTIEYEDINIQREMLDIEQRSFNPAAASINNSN